MPCLPFLYSQRTLCNPFGSCGLNGLKLFKALNQDTQALRHDSFTNFRTKLLLWPTGKLHIWTKHQVLRVFLKAFCVLASSSDWCCVSLIDTPRISHSSSSSVIGKASQKRDSETRCLAPHSTAHHWLSHTCCQHNLARTGLINSSNTYQTDPKSLYK